MALAKYGTPKRKREALKKRPKTRRGERGLKAMRKHQRQQIVAGKAPHPSKNPAYRGR